MKEKEVTFEGVKFILVPFDDYLETNIKIYKTNVNSTIKESFIILDKENYYKLIGEKIDRYLWTSETKCPLELYDKIAQVLIGKSILSFLKEISEISEIRFKDHNSVFLNFKITEIKNFELVLDILKKYNFAEETSTTKEHLKSLKQGYLQVKHNKVILHDFNALKRAKSKKEIDDILNS